ncbi:DUF4188 domain-containing protein [Nostoc sp. UHCC 0302]|uniref:DUF4188 domain-containing protein n=1 Tax=Nostoc sp. UHCC 0302 TaxID=3134896 RepID=UPI00311CB1BD
MSYSVYRINLPESPEAIVFVNGFVARDKPGTACAKGDRAGFFWMWKQLWRIKNVTAKAKDCMQVKAGICGLNEAIVVSYWVSENSLKEFFRGEPNRQMMQFIAKILRACVFTTRHTAAYIVVNTSMNRKVWQPFMRSPHNNAHAHRSSRV